MNILPQVWATQEQDTSPSLRDQYHLLQTDRTYIHTDRQMDWQCESSVYDASQWLLTHQIVTMYSRMTHCACWYQLSAAWLDQSRQSLCDLMSSERYSEAWDHGVSCPDDKIATSGQDSVSKTHQTPLHYSTYNATAPFIDDCTWACMWANPSNISLNSCHWLSLWS